MNSLSLQCPTHRARKSKGPGKNPGTLRGSLGNSFRGNVQQQCPRVFSRSRKQAVLLASLMVCCAAAQDARQIVEESQRRGRANSQRYEGVLEVVAADGKTSSKSWQSLRLGSYGNSKAVIRFTAPAEVKGVALLIVNPPDRASDQWMWTPAIGRDRRIALQDRSTRFFGTDFSFEDLEERDVNQYDYKLLADEGAMWKLESRPRKSSQYEYSYFWIRKENYTFVKIEAYSKKGLVRVIDYKNYEQIKGIWTARLTEVYDVARKSHTILKYEKLEYNLPMKDDDFTLQALRRDL